MTNQEKINLLRKNIQKQEVSAFIVPRTDEYLGEYIPDSAERLKWLTGFTGSAGLAVVTLDKAVVMSDGRYTIQLADEVDAEIFELANSQEVKLSDWLRDNINAGDVVGFDPKIHTPAEVTALQEKNIKLKAVPNLIDDIWVDQPEAPMTKVMLFPENIAGVSAADKIKNLQTTLSENKADAVLLTMSDSVAWLLNIRGNDIPYIPVCLSYVLVPAKGKVQWFVDDRKITNDVREALSEVVDFITPPEKIEDVLKGVKAKVWLDEKRTPIYFKDILQYSGSEIWNKEDPCLLPRACKNKSEQNAMKRAHLRDAKAFIQFEKWLYENWQGQTELSVEKKLEEFRAQAPEFKEPSFNTIAGYGEHGAIVHYRATDKSNVALQGDSLFLLDSGAQYLDGTTDITRTYCFGTPTEDMKKSYTLVLKGHIALASAVFKKGTTGKEIDVLARQYLREHGMDYAHGTGHGVGCYLSVHEEAAGLSPRGDRPLEEGMILSNEPGYYKEGEYGIRIENLVLVKEYDAEHFCFETITLVPIATNLIDEDLMTEDEVKWLEEYHVRVDRARA